jgi:hypothetical protein
MKRTLLFLGDLEIQIDWEKEELTLYEGKLMPWRNLEIIPKEAILFNGSAEELIERLRNR